MRVRRYDSRNPFAPIEDGFTPISLGGADEPSEDARRMDGCMHGPCSVVAGYTSAQSMHVR